MTGALVRAGGEAEIPARPDDGDPLPLRGRFDLRPAVGIVDDDDLLSPQRVKETPECLAGAVGNNDDRRS